jgi:hypothetical protein
VTSSAALKQSLNDAIVDHFTELDDSANFVQPPATDDDLDSFIKAAYGVSLPRKVVVPGHQTPFQFVADLFFERVRNALAFANRNGGKTYAVAILNHLEMVFKPRCEITSAGAVQKQADRCYGYFRDFLEYPWFQRLNERYESIAGKPLCRVQKDSIKSHTTFAHKAKLEIVTASQTGFRGAHPHKNRLDELDEIEWPLVQASLSMARTADGIRGTNVFTSTRQYIDGSMDRLLTEAQQRGIEVYEWNIYETVEKCTRRCKNDPKHGDCPIYSRCQGKAHHGSGFYVIEDYIDKVRVLDVDNYATEWLNEKPEKHKLVYHMLSQRHIMTPAKLEKLTGQTHPDATWHRISGIDFGSSPGHPFVYLKFFQIPNINAWLLYYEYVAEQRLLKDHAAAIKRSPYYLQSEIIYRDWAAQEGIELRDKGVRTRKAQKGDKSVNAGIDHICELLNGYPPDDAPGLYIWHECTYTIAEWHKYSWPVLASGKIDRSGNPEKRNDHTSDAARYCLFSYKKGSGPKYRGMKVRGL